MRRRLPILLSLLCLSAWLRAQTGTLVFDDLVLHRIDVSISIPDWFAQLEQDYANNAADPDSFPEIYRPCDITFDGLAVTNCGIREKGNSSNGFNNGKKKKPFKIAFDAFTEQKFDQIKKINLNNFTNDPSLMRESIVYQLMRKNGIDAPRTSFARVYFNGEYWGLYLLVENEDKTFLREHFGSGNEDGNLYKTQRITGATLEWKGDSAGAYNQNLKLTTNEDENDWSGLIHFIDVLNHTPDADVSATLPQVFDVNTYLRVLAIEKLVRSWDSYWGGGNNYALYEHPDGVMRWIPWDVNETFQDLKFWRGTSLTDGYLVPVRNIYARPLLRRILEVPEWKTAYLDGACEIMAHSFRADSIAPSAARWHSLIDDAYREDPNKLNSYEAFASSLHDYNQETVNITKGGLALRLNYPGIFPFIQSQREWAMEQIGKWGLECDLSNGHKYKLLLYPNPATESVSIAQSGDFDYAQVSIYNMEGLEVASYPWQNYSGSAILTDISAFTPGLYLVVKTSANGDVGTGRFVKM